MTVETTPQENAAPVDGAPASTTSSEATANDTAAPAAEAGAEAPADQATAAPEVPEAYRAEDGSPDLAKLIERAQAADTRAEGVPESADKYDLALAEEIKLPDGTAIQIDPENAQVKDVLAVLHENGVPQSVVTPLLQNYAKALAGDMSAMREAMEGAVKDEIAKLGDDAGPRLEGMQTAFTQILGDAAQATAALNEIRSVEGFKAWEAVVSKINGGDENARTPGGGSGQPEWTPESLYPSMQPSKTAAR